MKYTGFIHFHVYVPKFIQTSLKTTYSGNKYLKNGHSIHPVHCNLGTFQMPKMKNSTHFTLNMPLFFYLGTSYLKNICNLGTCKFILTCSKWKMYKIWEHYAMKNLIPNKIWEHLLMKAKISGVFSEHSSEKQLKIMLYLGTLCIWEHVSVKNHKKLGFYKIGK